MILGNASPGGTITSILSAGDLWASRFTLAGAPPGAKFTKIRARVAGGVSDGNVRAVLYAASGATAGALVDWAQFTVVNGSAETVAEQLLTANAAATDGDYYLGIHYDSGAKVGLLGAGGTGNGKLRSIAYGAAPPDPFGSTGDLTNFTMCVEATVEAVVTGGPPNMSPPQFGGWGAC